MGRRIWAKSSALHCLFGFRESRNGTDGQKTPKHDRPGGRHPGPPPKPGRPPRRPPGPARRGGPARPRGRADTGPAPCPPDGVTCASTRVGGRRGGPAGATGGAGATGSLLSANCLMELVKELLYTWIWFHGMSERVAPQVDSFLRSERKSGPLQVDSVLWNERKSGPTGGPDPAGWVGGWLCGWARLCGASERAVL